LEVMKSLDDKSIDMVLTDPPYGTTACKWDSVIPFEPMWKELKRICAGPILLFGSEPFSSQLRNSNLKQFKYDWIWEKTKGTGHLNAKRMPLKSHEIISVFEKGPYYPQGTITGIFKNDRPSRAKGRSSLLFGAERRFGNSSVGNYPKSILKYRTDSFGKNCFAPTQKPVPLLEYLIKTYTVEGETVLDFTMGSGSTGVACKNLNRKFRCNGKIEIGEKHMARSYKYEGDFNSDRMHLECEQGMNKSPHDLISEGFLPGSFERGEVMS
jgi:hypothetical protein